ncbi:hypothetical protein GIB67_028777 [Kingdonia uniflora]|uniref:4-coumarate--CoA ligase n=1 Tax=Kingdonia uniflora TaxID=39325 RepID=A0A7J7M296_9MAGN|nr:hypothetical protein GIB67_028777 [Kingdonia uniflora]
MEETTSDPSIDPKSGFSSKTKTFHSLRPLVPLPSPSLPLSTTQFALSLLLNSPSSPQTTLALIDTKTNQSLTYSDFIHQIQTLASNLQTQLCLVKGETAFVLASPCVQIPVLYLALLSLGVIVSPANPISTDSEISRQVELTKPVIAFVSLGAANKVPSLRRGTVVVDSDEFKDMMVNPNGKEIDPVEVNQSETAAVLYSSGTTGRFKGVVLTHRNFIALLAGLHAVRDKLREEYPGHPVSLFTVPLFHVFGFFMCVRAVALGETVVLMERFDFVGMLKAIETFRVTFMPVSPPLVVAMAKLKVVDKYNLSSLMVVGCGGAPLGKEVSEKFTARLPHVQIVQGYGLTESTGGATRMLGHEETNRYGSVGRITENMEAKIVDPVTGEALLPNQRGELWLRGPIIMKGYIGDDEATASTLTSDGWLKTGDVCYIDSDGFLFVVDRLKELIKYKAYQVPPAELEHLLQSHPEIADAAVIPYPDDEAGQIPMAFVVRGPGRSVSEAEVMDFVAKQVAPYKKIRRVAFIDSIPKSPAGKILRRELIDIAHPGHRARL